MTAVKDLPVSWAKRLADLSNWSSSRIVVRMRQSVPNRRQYVKSCRESMATGKPLPPIAHRS